MFSVCDYLTILPHVPNKKERTHTCALYYLTLFGRVTQTLSQQKYLTVVKISEFLWQSN